MNIDFEKLPAVIFDWIESQDFESLDHRQQKEVLQHFSKEEYDELRQSAVGIKAFPADAVMEEGQRKDALLAHFDKHHGAAGAVSPRQIFWQAAAVFLFMLCGWLFYQVFDLRAQNVVREMAVTDTVYVDREVKGQPEIIHDTVFRYRESETTAKQDVREENRIEEGIQPDLGDFEILEASDLENISNSPRGGSMKDDSLLRKFGFISM